MPHVLYDRQKYSVLANDVVDRYSIWTATGLISSFSYYIHSMSTQIDI